jgi:hypothetical protein
VATAADCRVREEGEIRVSDKLLSESTPARTSAEVEMGRGADEVVKVVDSEDGEGEEEEAEAAAAEGSSKETPMLPRMPVRVLLAEGDDSTRHVISALLRKCGYRGAHCLGPRIDSNRFIAPANWYPF